MSAPINLPPELQTLLQFATGKYTFPFMLAPSDPWDGKVDITGWWISEKLDGVRALWTGSHFISRGTKDGGKVYNVPEWFRQAMPAGVVLDGELWLGRGRFDECSGICRRDVPRDQDWKGMTYVVFDAPCTPGTFEERIAYVEALCKRDGPLEHRRAQALPRRVQRAGAAVPEADPGHEGRGPDRAGAGQ
jgi:ATP-dependent DNA ligase